MSSLRSTGCRRGITTMNAFYASVGSPRFISAPMVDQSSLPWRLLVRKHGADLAFSQMMHARNFVIDKNYRNDCVDWNNYTLSSGDTNKELEAKILDSPLIAQLAGHDPSVLVEAGKYIHDSVAAIDLNLGCPQKIAKKGKYGAYLLPNKELIVALLTAMVDNLKCPITAKIRLLSTEAETLELVRTIESCGISMLTVHGRTVHQCKLFTGEANWDMIRKVKEIVSIPVIANGGIGCRADALRCLEETGADGVMSSEALLENPKLFSEEGDYLFQHDYARAQLETVREFLEITDSHIAPRPFFQVIRGHLFKMLHRFVHAPCNKDMQLQLATGDYEQMKDVIHILGDRLKAVGFDSDRAVEKGLLISTGYYMRNRDERAQNRVLALPKHYSRMAR